MKLSLFKTTIMFVLILTTTAYCQQQGLGFSFYGGGARSEGMGQAYIALSDDGSAGGWNPAGLYVHEKTLMAFSYGFLTPHGYDKYKATPNRFFLFDHSGNVNSINNWSIVSPMRIKNHHFVFNLSYTRNLDTYFEFREKLYAWSDFDPENPLDNNDPNTLMQREGGIHSVNLGFGTRISKSVAFGLSANIYTGEVVTDENRHLFLDTATYAGDAAVEVNIRSLDSTSYSGFNFTVGFLYTGEKFRSGLTIRTPFVMTSNSDSTLSRVSILNGLPEFDQQGTIFATDTVYIDNMTSKIDMPIMIGLGAAYNLKENWLVSADLEFRAFDGQKVQNLDSLILTATGDRDEYYSSTEGVPNWSDVIQFRFGTEYVFDTKFGKVPVRFGARNESFPDGNITNYTISYEGEKAAGGAEISDEYSFINNERVYYTFAYNTEKVTGYSVSIGTGIHWSQIMLDAAFTYTTYKQTINRDGQFKSENTWKNHHLNIGFTGYF